MSNPRDRNYVFYRFLLAAFFCVILCAGAVQAYEMTINCTDKIQRGLPLVVNGISNIPPGTSIDIVFTKSGYTVEEVERKIVTLQANQEFSVVFDTSNLTKGIYKVEVLPIPDYRYLGNSVTLRIVEIVDRSDELNIRSPLTQEMTGELAIDGAILGARNAGVQIEVTGPDGGIVYGPEFVKTDTEGGFTLVVPIDSPGTYNASFTDNKGYVGKVSFSIEKPPEITTTPTAVPTAVPTTVPVVSATAEASRDKPAYFTVKTSNGNVRIFTSSGIDWVIEYTDVNGSVRKVNNKGAVEGEDVVLHGTGDVVPVTVYPYKYSETGTVTLSAEGATMVTTEENPPATNPESTTLIPGSAPLPAIAVIIAVICVAFFLLRRKY
jgi:hypothetical protein